MRVSWSMREFINRAAIVLALSILPTLPVPAFSLEEAPPDAGNMQGQVLRDDATYEDPAKPEKSRVFGFDLGMSGGYSTGVSVSNFYYKPFGNLYLKHKYVKFTVGISRYQDYLITNGAGKFERVNITQPKVALSLYPHDMIELYGEYRFSAGDPSHYYRGHEGTAGFLLDFNPVSIDASVNIKKSAYRFKTVDWLNTFTLRYSDIKNNGTVNNYYTINSNNNKYLDDISTTVDCAWYIIDTTSIDASYFYLKSFFEYPKDTYYVHTGRIGVYSDVWKYISIYGGISLGIDAEEYLIAGGDLGMAFNILGYVTISATYLPGYYKSQKNVSSLDRLIELYSLYFDTYNIMGSDNPYLQSSLVGKSFMNHSFNFSVSYKY